MGTVTKTGDVVFQKHLGAENSNTTYICKESGVVILILRGCSNSYILFIYNTLSLYNIVTYLFIAESTLTE
jgi:hypothetical protein